MLHYVWNRFQSLYESLLDHIVHGLRRQQTHPAFIYSIQSVCGVAFIYTILYKAFVESLLYIVYKSYINIC
jgi:hypothetical protein